MLASTVFPVLLFLWPPQVLGQKKKVTEDPIDKIQVQANFNMDKFAGQWYLLSVASECNYLKANNHRVEATIINAARSTKPRETENLLVHTLRKMDGICWEIKQKYRKNKINGRFILKVRGSIRQLDMVVAETDYENYAILYYQRQKKITIKLYGRGKTVKDDIYRKFDGHASNQGIDLLYIYPFPTYGFCEKADQFHILDETSS
ncbi:complement component C8 gamma chain [Pelobates fuscus]|uniref:complement component C8 gamma chain n=1 Tax=Pelobates fuscus TaxID=191477 RepID=UPI002FE43CD1